MLFSHRYHEPIRRGEVTQTFRRWRRPQAREGGRYRLASGGTVEVTAVEHTEPGAITDGDAASAGFDSAARLLHSLGRFEGDLYRIAFRYVGELPDERALLAARDDLTDEERATVDGRLATMDGGERGAWTRDVLRLIESNEGVRAAELAQRLGRETVRFKADVRRLKALGLTDSLEVGYRLSARGRAFLGGVSGLGGS
ncbi:MAG: hypothetical protein WD734_06905 [Dehalococcoidia bacterium]